MKIIESQSYIQKMATPKKVISPEIQKQICDQYVSGTSPNDLAKIFLVSYKVIRQVLIDNKIPLRSRSDALSQKWKNNSEYAKIMSKRRKEWWTDRGGFYEHLSTLPVEKQNALIRNLCKDNANSKEYFFMIRKKLDQYIQEKRQRAVT